MILAIRTVNLYASLSASQSAHRLIRKSHTHRGRYLATASVTEGKETSMTLDAAIQAVPTMLIIWAAVTACFVALLTYRG